MQSDKIRFMKLEVKFGTGLYVLFCFGSE